MISGINKEILCDRRVRAFLSVKSTAGKIIMAPLRRVVGKIIDKSVNADRNPGRRNLYENTKILRRFELAEIKTIRERRKRQTTKISRNGSGIRFFAVEYRRIQYRYRFQNA